VGQPSLEVSVGDEMVALGEVAAVSDDEVSTALFGDRPHARK